ncbi:MAG: SAM-dependent methyltransferase [bacterium]
MKSIPEQSGRDGLETFFRRLEEGLTRRSLIRIVLGKYRGADSELQKILVRPVIIRDQECLSFVTRYSTRDVTRNVPVQEGIVEIRGLLGGEFKSAHVFSTTETVQAEITRKGTCRVSVSKVTAEPAPDPAHDQAKERLIDPARPFLSELGITRGNGQVLPSMSRKWKQINVFISLFQGALMASRIDRTKPVSVVDFGSGKGYLTFALYDYLTVSLGIEARVTGVERRDDLVGFCLGVARKLGMNGMVFHPGDVTNYEAGSLQVMIALHACDTATDMALAMGVRGGAEIMLCAPCCHKEIRPQMISPAVLKPVLQSGIHLGQEAEMVTDTLRALWLEASGYEAQVFEFISLEHTSKNKMILAVKRAQPVASAPILEKIQALKAFYGITTHTLEKLLAG